MAKPVTLGPYTIKGKDAERIREDVRKKKLRREARKYPTQPGVQKYLPKPKPKKKLTGEQKLGKVITGERRLITQKELEARAKVLRARGSNRTPGLTKDQRKELAKMRLVARQADRRSAAKKVLDAIEDSGKSTVKTLITEPAEDLTKALVGGAWTTSRRDLGKPMAPPKMVNNRFADAQLKRMDQGADALQRAASKRTSVNAMKVLDIAARPSYAVAAGVKAGVEGDNIIKGAEKGITGKDRGGFTAVMRELGVKNDVIANIAGFVGDVLLDPTTYLTLGAATPATVSLRAVEKAAFKEAGRRGIRSAAARQAFADEAVRIARPKIMAKKANNKGVQVGVRVNVPFTKKTVERSTSGNLSAKVLRATGPSHIATRARSSRPVQIAGRTLGHDFRPDDIDALSHATIREESKLVRARKHKARERSERLGRGLQALAVGRTRPVRARAAARKKFNDEAEAANARLLDDLENANEVTPAAKRGRQMLNEDRTARESAGLTAKRYQRGRVDPSDAAELRKAAERSKKATVRTLRRNEKKAEVKASRRVAAAREIEKRVERSAKVGGRPEDVAAMQRLMDERNHLLDAHSRHQAAGQRFALEGKMEQAKGATALAKTTAARVERVDRKIKVLREKITANNEADRLSLSQMRVKARNAEGDVLNRRARREKVAARYDENPTKALGGKGPSEKTRQGLTEIRAAEHHREMGVEMMSVDDLLRFREHKWTRQNSVGQRDYVSLYDDIKKNGIKEPLILEYGENGRHAYLGEGNTRLAIAKELGMEEVPVRVIRTRDVRKRQGANPVKGKEPDKNGYVPSYMSPSDIGLSGRKPFKRGERLAVEGPMARVHRLKVAHPSREVREKAAALREKQLREPAGYFPHMREGDLDRTAWGRAKHRLAANRLRPRLSASADKVRKVRLPTREANVARGYPKGHPEAFSEDAVKVVTEAWRKGNTDAAIAHFWDGIKSRGRAYRGKDDLLGDEAVYKTNESGKLVEVTDSTELSKGGKHLVVLPEGYVGAAEEVLAPLGRIPGIGSEMWGNAMGAYKYILTVPMPSYHVRNIIGDSFNAWLGDARAAFSPLAGKIIKARHQRNKWESSAEYAAGTAARPQILDETVKINGVDETVGDLLDEMEERLAIGGGMIGEEIPDLTKTHGAIEGLRRLSQVREDLPRAVSYLSARNRGMTPRQASAWVDKHHFDYGDLTAFEKAARQTLIPFWTFWARNTRLQVATLFQRPGKLANVVKGYNALARAAGFDDYQQYFETLEPYQQAGMPIPVKIAGRVQTLEYGLPPVDLKTTSLSPKDQVDYTLSRVHMLKLAPELAANYSFFLRDNIANEDEGSKGTDRRAISAAGAATLKALGMGGLVDKTMLKGKLQWTVPAKVDYAIRSLPELAQANKIALAVEGRSNTSSGLAVGGLFLGSSVKEYEPDVTKLNALYRRHDDLTSRQGRIKEKYGNEAGKQKPEYLKIKADLKKIEAETNALSKKVGRKSKYERSSSGGYGGGYGSGYGGGYGGGY